MKKWLTRILLILLILIVCATIWGLMTYKKHGPQYSKTIKMEGISSEVEVYYDEYAIPHIYASNNRDAYKAFGYIHASERLWQIDLIRKIGPGRLSELFGSATVRADAFFKTLGIAQYSKKAAKDFLARADNQVVREKVLAYIDGINHYIQTAGPTQEHRLLGVEMEPFTLEDIYNVLGYMSYSFAVAHKTEPLVDHIYRTYGPDYLSALDINVNPTTTAIQSGGDLSALWRHIDEVTDLIPAPELIGSNSWVIGPQKTTTGSVIFANDPHIGYAQPSVWYEAHIVTPEMEVYGYHLAGNPLAQIGHNRHHAIGLTMFENDDIDYYREKVNPAQPHQYMKKGQWVDFALREETIKVRDGQDTSFVVRETYHGPVITDVVDYLSPDEPVSMWWTYLKFNPRLLETTDKMLMATSLGEVQAAASMIHAPGLNVMYGDVQGNIAWWACAHLPIRPEHVNSKMILDGASGEDDVLGFYDFKENPQAINPPWGYVYSANNQSTGPTGLKPEGYYLPEDRARRIVHLLQQRDDWDTDKVKKMINDITSNNAPEIAAGLVQALAGESLTEVQQKVYSALKSWDGTYAMEQTAPTIYVKWLYHTIDQMLGDEMGDKMDLFVQSHMFKRSLQPLVIEEDHPWWDVVGTDATEQPSEVIKRAFILAIEELTEQLGQDPSSWTWDRVHTLRHPHAFTTNETLRDWFDVGTYAVPGGPEVINNNMFSIQGDGVYEAVAGPSTRRVINLGDLDEDSWSILPTGQSGNVQSPHYSDQAQMYVDGNFRRQLMDRDEIIEQQKYVQKLIPAN